jgi:adenine-specific DNA-methyltransferase
MDVTNEKLEQLKTMLPEAFTEGKIDWEKLQATLGRDINFRDERYVLNWAGKSDAFRAIQTPTTATLSPDREESVNFDETEHIFIEGENLEVLKVLQKAYYGKIKMIYIDPPYNTGNDSFVYPDKFSESREEYLKRIQSKDEEGLLLKEGQYRQNSKDSGHYHSNWLSMMYPRLYLARNLLRDDGVIFISIDDNEVHNLRLLMNEIFGEENFIADVVVVNNLKGRSDKKYIATAHERLLMFIKSSSFEEHSLEMPDEIQEDYKYIDDLGKYRLLGLRKRGGADTREQRPNMYFPIYVNQQNGKVSVEKGTDFSIEVLPIKSNGVDGAWRWGFSTVKKRVEVLIGIPTQGANEYRIYEKDYLETDGEIRRIKPKSVFYGKDYSTDSATKAYRKLFPEGNFNNPKSVPLLKDLIDYSVLPDGNEIILDFFSGSATIAQSTLELNSKDGGNRHFICVQLPEKIENFKFTTIAEIAKERIRKVIQNLKEENPIFSKEQDLGFKTFELRDSNFKLWRGDGIENQKELEQQLDILVEPVRPEAIEEHMLFELLLKSGYPLNTHIEKREVGSGHYYLVDGELAIALTHLDTVIVEDMLSTSPQQVIFLDALFKDDDSLKTNTRLQLADAGIAFQSI